MRLKHKSAVLYLNHHAIEQEADDYTAACHTYAGQQTAS
jgi:hypothetical protein